MCHVWWMYIILLYNVVITFGNYLIILPSKREIERKAAREERKKTRVTSPNRISMLSYYMNWNVYFIARASINWVAYKSIACILMRVQNIQFVTVRCVGVCVSVTSSEFACATFLINSFLILSSIHTANCQAHHVHIHMTVTLCFSSGLCILFSFFLFRSLPGVAATDCYCTKHAHAPFYACRITFLCCNQRKSLYEKKWQWQ